MTVERYDPPAASKNLALINPATDSWTAVLDDVIALAANVCKTEFVPKDMRGSQVKVVAAILHSRELGLPPMTGLAGSHVINGRPGISAELMRSLIEQAGHGLRVVEMSADRCVMKGRRSTWDQGEWTTVTYSMTDAARAGDAQKNANYKTRPAEMLLARCTTRLARMVFADVIHGMRSVEELQDMTEAFEDGPMQPIEQTVTKVSRQVASPAPAVEEEPQAAPGGVAPMAMGGVPAAGEAASEQRPAASPARKCAPLTPRGRATQPVPEPAPEPSEVVEEPEVVEAELVEDVPAEASNVTPLGAAKSVARQGMVTSVQMQFERLLGKPVDREERLWYTGLIVGRVVGSTNELDGDDLRKVLKTVERLRNREQLEALNNPPEGGE